MSVQVEAIVVGGFQSNCFLVWDDARQAIVIDPGADAGRIAARLNGLELGVAAYVLTHGHMDHVSAVAELYDAFPAPVAMHPADLSWAFSEENYMLPFYAPPRRPRRIERLLAENQVWTDGGLAWRVLSTPGHTPGCVCLHFEREQAVFTGDTLFAGCVGRTDLAGGDADALASSILRLARLPPATAVYPGHGPATDIGHELRTNGFMVSLRMAVPGAAGPP